MHQVRRQIDVINGQAAAHWVALRDRVEIVQRHRKEGGKKAAETRRARSALRKAA
jgi:hypothetical protein